MVFVSLSVWVSCCCVGRVGGRFKVVVFLHWIDIVTANNVQKYPYAFFSSLSECRTYAGFCFINPVSGYSNGRTCTSLISTPTVRHAHLFAKLIIVPAPPLIGAAQYRRNQELAAQRVILYRMPAFCKQNKCVTQQRLRLLWRFPYASSCALYPTGNNNHLPEFDDFVVLCRYFLF